MPARNAAAHIAAAARSVLDQTLRGLELLVIDDGSTDGTASTVEALARLDPRVRLIAGPGRGPAAARNLGLRAAQGRWIAVMDADDLIDPDRLSHLVDRAEQDGADVIADNLRAFYEDGQDEHAWLQADGWQRPGWITPEALLRLKADEELGYLKPVIRTEWLRANGLAYDENLRIGEDYDLILRALILGARYRFVPSLGYRYRRHPGSISHRLDATQVSAMILAMRRLQPSLSPEARRLAERRLDAMQADRDFAILISDLKGGRYAKGVRALGASALRARLLRAVMEGATRRLRGARRPTEGAGAGA